MIVELRNVAKVREAVVRIDGITVLAGFNGSGKSTVSRGAWALISVFRTLWERVEKERILSMATLLRQEFFVSSRIFQRLTKFVQEIGLDKAFFANADRVYNWLEEQQLIRDPRLSREAFIARYEGLQEGLQAMLARPDEDYARFVFEKMFGTLFSGQIGPLTNETAISEFVLSVEGARSVVAFQGQKTREFEAQVTNAIGSVFYVSPSHNLDDYAERDHLVWSHSVMPEMDVVWQSALYRQGADETFESLEETERLEHRRVLMDDIVQTVHGRLGMEDARTLRFSDMDTKCSVAISNMASGAKSIAMLVRALETGAIREKGLVILDEPESNLHPEWQVRFAEFLVLMVNKLGIRVLLNTHSPYFLRAVEVFAKQHRLTDRLHAYEMCPVSEEGPIAFVAQEATDDLARIYKSMAKPFDELL